MLLNTRLVGTGAVLALCVLVVANRSAAAERATTAPATRATTSKPIADPAERLNAEVKRSWKDVFPAELRESKGEPTLTDEQKLLARLVQTLLITSDATPQRLVEAEKNRAQDPERLAALEKARNSVRSDLVGQPEDIIVETEKALASEIELVRIFQAMMDSPVTRGATQEQVELKAMEKIRDLPAMVRKLVVVGIEAKHHAARAKLLTDIAALSKQAESNTDRSARKRLEERIAALQELLKAVDARAAAEKRVSEVTPLGWLNNVGDEK